MTMDPQITAALIGGAATVAAAIIGWWLHERKSHRKLSENQTSTESVQKYPPTDKTNLAIIKTDANKHQPVVRQVTSISNITVKDIVESINSAPPFQKEQIAKQYNGITVKWIGHLKEVMEDPRDKESVRVNLTINQDTYIGDSFWFSEKVENFPEIRTLKRGSAVSVVGEVLSASGPGLCVDLKPIVIEVLGNHHA
ncbi:MAG: hypothetical protein FP815_03950 [Desulfobulbaceae bacterium]|nr:hypothetical protein [Desulfobulbaceae bacterium]